MAMLLLPHAATTGFGYPSGIGRGALRNRSFVANASPSRTRKIMENILIDGEVGGAGGAYSYNALKRLDQLWLSMCSLQPGTEVPVEVVLSFPGSSSNSDHINKSSNMFDVLVCGGTLGIFVATSLSSKGLRVGIVERNLLKGRAQEWNISMKELLELVQVGILVENDIEQVTAVKFNPNRCGFEGKGDIWVEDILNLGVSPAKLLEVMRKRFLSFGGTIFEGCSLSSISVYNDAAVLKLADGKVLSARLIIDAMGNFSPVVKQVRSGKKPDGVCLVVGSCSRGFKENTTSDVIFSNSLVKKVGDSEVQYFWEAFPAGSDPTDRTIYMFTYLDAQPGCPALEQLFEDYWDLMPAYQGIPLDELDILRVIFGIFPTYRDSLIPLVLLGEDKFLNSPLPAAFDRILQVGDASGIQSPVSFGGFGSMTRHLGRLSTGIYEAVSGDFLDSDNLSLLNPYMPNLSASWLFQRAMSARPQAKISPDFINELLYTNFQCMQRLGDPVLRPFLQDVIQFGPLVKTLGSVMLTKPQILPSIFKQVRNSALYHDLVLKRSIDPWPLLSLTFRGSDIQSQGLRIYAKKCVLRFDNQSATKVGIPVILDWFVHFTMLGYYTFLSSMVDPVMRPWINAFPNKMKYYWKRRLEAWKFGSGLDYEHSNNREGGA